MPACCFASSASTAARSLARVSWNRPTLLGGQGFAAGAKAHPAQVRQLQGEGLNLDMRAVQLGVAVRELLAESNRLSGVLLCLADELLNRTGHPLREFGRGVQSGQFSVQIPTRIIPPSTPECRMNRAFTRYLLTY